MNETIRLGSFAGVRIGVNWSVLVIAGLLLLGLSAGRFPFLYPDEPTWAYVVAGLVAAVVFFGSLLAHELAHAIVARRHGVEVEGITLWMFGGVARLLGEASDPVADLRIAGVGPLVSLGLGAAFGVVTLVGASLGVTGLTLGVLSWLALINVALALFNLIPAAPLDGGRILRAILWRRRGDRFRAAVVAARAGRQFGFLMVMLGLVMLVLLPGLGGIWIALVGWFIASAASSEEQQTRMQHRLRDLRVGDVMTAEPWTVPAGIDVARLLDEHVLRHRCSAFPVVDVAGRLEGLVTLHRIKPIAEERRAQVRVEEIAAPREDVATATSTDRLLDVLPEMGRSTDHRIVVVDDDRVVGIVSPTDIARTIELAELTAAVPDRAARS